MRVHCIYLYLGSLLILCWLCHGLNLTTPASRLSKTRGRNIRNCTSGTLCCRVGRRAARHQAIAPLYTCRYEAVWAGLDHHASVANRLRAAKGLLSLGQAQTASGLRYKMSLCFRQFDKQCFEKCCSSRRKRMRSKRKLRAFKIPNFPVESTSLGSL